MLEYSTDVYFYPNYKRHKQHMCFYKSENVSVRPEHHARVNSDWTHVFHLFFCFLLSAGVTSYCCQ